MMKKYFDKLNKKGDKKGFTLIELVVVMAIIGILVLLAAPKFLGYTKDATATQVQYDSKVYSDAVLMYNADNEKFPTTGADLSATTAAAVKTAYDKKLDSTKNDATIQDGTTFLAIDATKLGDYIKDTSDLSNYVVAIGGPHEGEVFKLASVENKAGDAIFGATLAVPHA